MNNQLRFSIFWTLFVILLSALSGNTVSKLMVIDFFGIDKLGHALFYAILSWSWLVSFTSLGKRKSFSILYALSISTLVGTSMEFAQLHLFEGRSFEYDDMAANIFGSLIGLGVWYLTLKVKNKR